MMKSEEWHKQYQTYAYDYTYARPALDAPRFSASMLHYSVQLARQLADEHTVYLLSDSEIDNSVRAQMEDVVFATTLEGIEISQGFFVLAFEADDIMLQAARRIEAGGGRYMGLRSPYWNIPCARYFHRNAVARSVLRVEADSDFLHFDAADYENIFQAIDLTRTVAGAYVEIGVYKGARARAALRYLTESQLQREVWLLDTFEGMRGEWVRNSAEAGWSGAFADTSINEVRNNLTEFPEARLVKNNIVTDALPTELGQVAVANVDVDSKEAVWNALLKLHPLIPPKGIIICDDQGHTPSLCGAYVAYQEFIESDMGKEYIPVHFPTGQGFLIKCTPDTGQ